MGSRSNNMLGRVNSSDEEEASNTSQEENIASDPNYR